MSGNIATADVCDANPELLGSGELRVLPAVFKSYGRRKAFSGRVVTVKVFDDNVLVRTALEGPGEGKVLVVDGAGSMRCALLGGNVALLAAQSGWSGVVVYGCVRDVDEINVCDVGVLALASHPVKSAKRGVGENNVPVHIAGTLVRDGDWLYADADGIIVSPSQLNA